MRYVIMFLEVIWKLFMILIFIKLFCTITPQNCIHQIILLSSIISMLIGAIMPIIQKNIHKFIASVTIGHIGFALSIQSLQNSMPLIMTYMSYQSLATFCFLAGILAIPQIHSIRTFEDLRGFSTLSPIFKILILFSLFAICGLPPFGNFYAKLNIFMLLIKNKNYFTLFITLIHSVISIVYIVKRGRFLFNQTKAESTLHQTSYLFETSLIILLTASLVFYNPINQFWMQIFKHIE